MDGAVLNINSTTYNLNLASLSISTYGSVLPYTIVNVNAPIYGINGVDAKFFNSSLVMIASPTIGLPAINLSGFSGKIVKIVNNSTIKGGNGGNVENRKIGDGSCKNYTIYGASGGDWKSAESNLSINILGNPPEKGASGRNGTMFDCVPSN